MATSIEYGFNGNCAEHKTHPAIARATESTADITLIGKPEHLFGRVLMIHCAAGHQYYAVKQDDLIEDPFTEEETVRIYKEELKQ